MSRTLRALIVVALLSPVAAGQEKDGAEPSRTPSGQAGVSSFQYKPAQESKPDFLAEPVDIIGATGRRAPAEPAVLDESDPRVIEMRKAFGLLFGEAIAKARATPETDDDGRLAEAIYEQAQKPSKYPGFTAHALDQVVALAENSPGKRRLAYDALAELVQMRLRPAPACYDKMMVLGPNVFDEVDGNQRRPWAQRWHADAVAYAALLIDGLDYAKAAAVVADAEKVIVQHQLPKPTSPLAPVLTYVKTIDAQRTQYEADVAAGKASPAARVFLGVMALARRDRAAAAAQLEAAGQKGKDLLAAANALEAKADAATNLTFAAAAESLAGLPSVHPWAAAVLLKEAQLRAGNAESLAPEGPDKVRAGQLAGRLKDKIGKSQLPAEVAATLPTLVGPKAGSSTAGGIPGFGAVVATADGTSFFGTSLADAKKIVYVVDRSGSITDSMMYVKFELRRSIRSLAADRQFYVVFFSSGPAVPMPSGKMVSATENNKMLAAEFIDGIVPVGQTDPSEALKLAFAEKPEAVVLLTDGEFDQKVVPLIDTLNKERKVAVHTFCFLYSQGEAILQEIAKKNGGTYRYVSDVDLQNLSGKK